MQKQLRVGDYIFIKEITQGKTADMFLGINKNDNEIVFIKRIKKSKLDSETKKKLLNELNILNKLSFLFKNIISMKQFISSEHNYYYIFEYCNGGNLSEYVKDYIKENKKPINEFFIQKIIRQIVSGIESLHSKKIIHRNIKLENILLNFDYH